jgi:hypothetical protein
LNQKGKIKAMNDEKDEKRNKKGSRRRKKSENLGGDKEKK